MDGTDGARTGAAGSGDTLDGVPPVQLPDSPLTAAVQAVLPAARADLERLVRIPSVWADPQPRSPASRIV